MHARRHTSLTLAAAVATTAVAILLPAAPARAGSFTFRDGLFNDFTAGAYAGTKDATVLAPSTGSPAGSDANFGLSTGLTIRNTASARYRSLVAFDLSSLQGLGVTVTDASLTFYKGANAGSDSTTNYFFTANPLASTNAGWVEGTGNGSAAATAGEVTGNNRAAAGPGGSPAALPWLNSTGGNATLVSGAFTPLFSGPNFTYGDDAALTPYVLSDPSLAPVVQSWIDTPANNAGLMIANGGGSAQITLTSSEYTSNTAARPTLTLTLSSPTMSAGWAADQDATWSTPANWSAGAAPNSVGAIATFGNVLSAPRTVTVDGDQILSTLVLESPSAYTLAGPGTLRLIEVNAAQATINVTTGSHTIAAPISVTTNTTVTVSTGSELDVTGPISGVSRTLTKAGAGTLALSAVNPLTGTVALTEGTLRLDRGDALTSAIVDVGPGGALAFAPATTPVTLAGLNGSGAVTLNATDGAPVPLVLDTNAAPSFSGSITGSGSLTKTGTTTQTLSGTNSWTGGTTIAAGTLRVTTGALTGDVVNNGTLAFFQNPDGTFTANVSGTGSISKSGTGVVTWTHPLPGGNLNLTAGTLALAPASGTSRVATLTATSANLDIADNRLVLTNTTPTNLVNALANARNGGAWDGTKGLTSSVANADPSHTTAIGWAAASDIDLTAWGGDAAGLAPTDLVTRVTSYGDLNLDGAITPDDYVHIDRAYAVNQSGGSLSGWINGDVNYDNFIDSNDYLLMDTAYGHQLGSLSPDFLAQRQAEFGDAYVSALAAAVPEPTSLAACGLALLPLLTRRRHRHHD